MKRPVSSVKRYGGEAAAPVPQQTVQWHDSWENIAHDCRVCGKHVRRDESQLVQGNTVAHWACAFEESVAP